MIVVAPRRNSLLPPSLPFPFFLSHFFTFRPCIIFYTWDYGTLMAEAGPSRRRTTSSAASVPPSSPSSKQSAIQFSAEGSQSNLRGEHSHPIGLGRPPILRNSTVRPSPPSVSSTRSEDGRRRVKSAEQSTPSHRTQRSIDGNGIAARRSAVPGRNTSRRERGSYGAGVADDANGTSILSAFSDEYNLCMLCSSVCIADDLFIDYLTQPMKVNNLCSQELLS